MAGIRHSDSRYRNIISRFFSFVEESDNGCWRWIGGISGNGYGNFSICHKSYTAPRVSYKMFIDEIPDGMYVCHICDNPACVNPGHLFIGTHRENLDDMLKKGRSAKHEKNSHCKLTYDQVIEIREKYKSGILTPQLAREYKIGQSQAVRIVRGYSWR